MKRDHEAIAWVIGLLLLFYVLRSLLPTEKYCGDEADYEPPAPV
jgi:hypothetical protein